MYILQLPSSNPASLHPNLNVRTLDTLHLFLIVHCIYYYLVAHYADISVLTEIVWSFKVSFFGASVRPHYDTNGVMQLQIVIDVSGFSHALQFAHTSITGYDHLRGTSVSRQCIVVHKLKN